MLKICVQARLQKPAQTRVRGKQAGFQKDETYCQLSWNKWMTMMMKLENLFAEH